MYAVYHGPEGLTAIARKVHRRTAVLAAGLRQLGFTLASDAFFDTVTVDAGGQRDGIVARARSERINLGIGGSTLRIALDETTTPDIVEAVWRAFGGKLSYAEIEASARAALPAELKRTGRFLTHPVFHAHRSETEMLRYMRKLSDRDLALDRAMIPLGSCTMKLNATSEMIPLTWPAFATLHPFAPARRRAATTRCSSGWKNGSATSPATTRCRCSRTRARRANMPGFLPSALTMPRAAKATARSA